MQKLLGNMDRGLPFVISAPSGCGKDTLLRMLTDEFDVVTESVSCTTRKPRPGEIDGVNYHFLNKETFDRYIQGNRFLEHATVFGNQYGTLRDHLEEQLESGKHTFMVIDTEGAVQLLANYPAIFIFIMPPSLEELEVRLRGRGTEDEGTIQGRLECAKREIAIGKSSYQYHIINEDLSTAYAVLRSLVIAEEHRNIL